MSIEPPIVYFIEYIDESPYWQGRLWFKIGYTTNPQSRFLYHKCHLGLYVKLLGFIEGDEKTEVAIHDKFSEHRTGRIERFSYHKSIFDYIKENTLPPPQEWQDILASEPEKEPYISRLLNFQNTMDSRGNMLEKAYKVRWVQSWQQ